jgi:hypothetical protein
MTRTVAPLAVLVVGLSLVSSSAAAQGWAGGPRLSTRRMDPAAVALNDGRVLVVGGAAFIETRAGSGQAGSDGAIAELWSPGDARWRRTADLASGRMGHSATVLADGRVLVAGGVVGVGPQGSAELWDPSTGCWTSAGSMVVPRTDHRAVALADGRLLVVGGIHTGNINDPSGTWTSIPVETAEIWSPATNRWTAAGDHGRREAPTATLLADGRVLVAGGAVYGAATADAVVFDPRTSRWTPTGPMHSVRSLHAAARLADGRVLVAGGSHDVEPRDCGELDGRPPCHFVGTAEIWDPRTGAWTPTDRMTTARTGHSLVALAGGRVAALGGIDIESLGAEMQKSVELFDPGTNAWTRGRSMLMARTTFDVVVLADGRLVVIGGEGQTTELRRHVEIGSP